jgi:hypothetical protein
VPAAYEFFREKELAALALLTETVISPFIRKAGAAEIKAPVGNRRRFPL